MRNIVFTSKRGPCLAGNGGTFRIERSNVPTTVASSSRSIPPREQPNGRVSSATLSLRRASSKPMAFTRTEEGQLPKERTPITEVTGARSVFSAVVGARFQGSHELLKQLRVPQESHLRKLLTAAHTYSLNWSRITSTSAEPTRPADGAQNLAQPSRETSRVTVGRGREARFTSHDWDAGLSWSLYCPPPGSFSRKRLSGNTGPPEGELLRVTRTPPGQTSRSELHPYYAEAE